jgi:hypothetical protein
MRWFGTALIFSIFALAACAGGKPEDRFTGYYIGPDQGMRISRTSQDKFLIVLKNRSGGETAVLTENVSDKLTSLSEEGYTVVQDSGVDYSLGFFENRQRLQKTDSVGYAVWWQATQEWSSEPPDSTESAEILPIDD